jgi:hypothetical protein
MKFTWYVAFEVPKALKPRGRRIPRATETFESELEAKEFARAKYAAGLKLNANERLPGLISSLDRRNERARNRLISPSSRVIWNS